jgi:hypothetical protein
MIHRCQRLVKPAADTRNINIVYRESVHSLRNLPLAHSSLRIERKYDVACR